MVLSADATWYLYPWWLGRKEWYGEHCDTTELMMSYPKCQSDPRGQWRLGLITDEQFNAIAAEYRRTYIPEPYIAPVIALSGLAAGGPDVPASQIQYAGVPIIGYTPAEYAAVVARGEAAVTLATQMAIAELAKPDFDALAGGTVTNVAPAATGADVSTGTGLTALYDTIKPYVVPVIAGLVVTVIVMLFLGSKGGTPSTRGRAHVRG